MKLSTGIDAENIYSSVKLHRHRHIIKVYECKKSAAIRKRMQNIVLRMNIACPKTMLTEGLEWLKKAIEIIKKTVII